MKTNHTKSFQYEVTEGGKVFSVNSNWRGYGKRELKQQPHKDGYPCVRMVVDGTRKKFLVHLLVAANFLPPKPSSKHQVRHLDGNKWNNSKSNLAWGTAKENADDREAHGRTSKGFAHSLKVREGLYANR